MKHAPGLMREAHRIDMRVDVCIDMLSIDMCIDMCSKPVPGLREAVYRHVRRPVCRQVYTHMFEARAWLERVPVLKAVIRQRRSDLTQPCV